MTKDSPFSYFKISPEIIRLAGMFYVRFPLSLCNVENLLHERGVDVSNETVRLWWNYFGPMSASKINGERHYLWLAEDHEGEVLESYVSKRWHSNPYLKSIKRNGQPRIVITDKLRSYRAAMMIIGNADRQKTDRWINNRAENSHLPFRRRERAMLRFRRAKTLQNFVSIHASIQNHFNQEHHLNSHTNFKPNRTAALAEWRQLLNA